MTASLALLICADINEAHIYSATNLSISSACIKVYVTLLSLLINVNVHNTHTHTNIFAVYILYILFGNVYWLVGCVKFAYPNHIYSHLNILSRTESLAITN